MRVNFHRFLGVMCITFFVYEDDAKHFIYKYLWLNVHSYVRCSNAVAFHANRKTFCYANWSTNSFVELFRKWQIQSTYLPSSLRAFRFIIHKFNNLINTYFLNLCAHCLYALSFNYSYDYLHQEGKLLFRSFVI